MDITELKDGDRRLEIAFEQFEAGESIIYEGVRFQITKSGILQIDSYSSYSNPQQITPKMASSGISRSKLVLSELCKRHPKYEALIENVGKEYYFCCDYQTGAFALAKEISGHYQWLMKQGS